MIETSTTAEAMEADVLATEATEAGVAHPPAPRAQKPKSPAEWAYQRLILYLKAFEEGLDDDHEAAMGFTSGAGSVLRILGMGFHAPDIVTFTGRDEAGARAQVIQHVSQLNVMLRAVPRRADAEARRIGFALARVLEEAPDAESPEADSTDRETPADAT
jgi:hypothetical protein